MAMVSHYVEIRGELYLGRKRLADLLARNVSVFIISYREFNG